MRKGTLGHTRRMRSLAKIALGLLAIVLLGYGITGLRAQHQIVEANARTAAAANSKTRLIAAQEAADAPASTTSAQPKVALFVGDSYTAVGNSYAARTCAAMGWTCRIDGQGSTGYVADGHLLDKSYTPYLARLDKDAATQADYVFVTGGRNDTPQIKNASREYLAALDEAMPDARVFVLAPFWNTTPAPGGIQRFRTWVHDAANRIDAAWINTDGWLSPEDIGLDDVHPTPDGQQVIADELVKELHARRVS